MLPSSGRPGAATMTPGTSALIGTPSALAPFQRRPSRPLGQRLSAKAILEKVKEVVTPSNGAALDWKPKSDPASIEADVLQNLGMPNTIFCNKLFEEIVQLAKESTCTL